MWDRNSESNIAGYILSYGTQSGTYSTSIDVGNVTTRQVNLTAGQRYYFVVQAYNTSSQTSPRSAEVFFDVGVGTTRPNITSLSPTSGSVGTSVTITGTNFGSTKGTSTVTFNGTLGTPTTWSGTRIVVPVPAGASTGNVVVTVGGLASNGVSFTVPTAGGITLVQRRSLAGSGTSAALAFASSNTAGNFIAVAVRVYGTNQTITVRDSRANVYQQAVKFNNGVNDTLGIYYAQNIAGGANTVTVSNATSSASIRVAILEYAGVARSGALDVTKTNTLQNAAPTTGNVTTTANGDLLLGVFSTSDAGTFTAGSGYTIRETIDAPPSTRLMIEDRIQPTAGTTSATATLGSSAWWGAALAAFKPASSGTGTPPPTITNLSPTSASVGTRVAITGTNFGASQGTSTLRFNGTVATTPAIWSATRIEAFVPFGATSGNVVVTVGGVASNGVSLTVTPSPSITSLSRTSGSVGTSVTITGTNFGSTKGASTVTFNGTLGTPTTWSAASIVVPVPAGATTGNLVVTVGGVASNGVSFTVVPTAGAITLVQRRSLAGSGTSAALAFASSNTAGNFIAVAVRVYGTNQTITVRDSRANVYQQAVKFNNGVNDTLGIYYAQNIAGGANTVTVSNATSSASIRVAILEYAGIARSGALDVTKTNTLQNAAPTTGNVTTTANGDLLLGVFSTAEPGTFTAGSGYTIRETNDAAPSTRLMIEDRIQPTAGTTSATATLGSSVWWGAALAAFKPASSGTTQLALTGLTAASAGTGFQGSSQPVVPPSTDDDYDGDGKADVAVVTPSTGTWSVLESSTGTAVTATLGPAGDRPVPGDYDGDRKTDIAVYHPATGKWSVLQSSTGAVTVVTWGSATDLAVPADYDGDGTTDVAIYRPSTGEWITFQSSTQTTRTVAWGSSADIPVPGDYDGDAKADLAVYRPGTGLWQILRSGTNVATTATRGSSGDVAIPSDYDGDGKTDIAVYHASTGLWSILQSSTNTMRTVTWGSASDVPTPGDYDGDGATDLAVFRPSTGLWQILQSSTNTTRVVMWGMSTDVPVP